MWHRSTKAETEGPLPLESDSAVVAAAKLDPDAFAPLYERYRDDILRYSYRCLGNWEEAADAAQEVFADVIAGLPRFRHGHDNSFRCWLFRIAHNEVCDRQRRRKRRDERPLADGFWVVDPARSPEELAIAADDHQRLHAMLCQLPLGQRRVCELRLSELSNAEVGQILGKSEVSVRKAHYDATKSLRNLLGETMARTGGLHA